MRKFVALYSLTLPYLLFLSAPSTRTLAACREELAATKQELSNTKRCLKKEEERTDAIQRDLIRANKRNDDLTALLDEQHAYLEAAAEAKQAEQARKLKQDLKAKQRERLDPLFVAQVGSPARKVREARRKLAAEVHGKGDIPAPPSPARASQSVSAQTPCPAEPMISTQKSAAPLRSCLKRPAATPPLPSALETAIAREDPFIDVRSPRKDRNIRRVPKVPHLYTPTEPQPLLVTLDCTTSMCSAAPQQKPRSDGDLHTTLLTPYTNTNVPSVFGQALPEETHIQPDISKARLGSKRLRMPVELIHSTPEAWLSSSPVKQFTRRPAFRNFGKAVNRMVAIRT